MTKYMIVVLVIIAATLAWAASSYNVNLPKPAVVGGVELKAGDYKVELNGDKVTLKRGKTSAEADVSVENGPTKFGLTSACCMSEDGASYRLQEIRVGGTNTKITFKQSSGMAVGK